MLMPCKHSEVNTTPLFTLLYSCKALRHGRELALRAKDVCCVRIFTVLIGATTLHYGEIITISSSIVKRISSLIMETSDAEILSSSTHALECTLREAVV